MNVIKIAGAAADMRLILHYYGFNPNSNGFIKCPFHSEKTASLGIYNKNRWHCFGCGAGGDAVDFIQRIECTDSTDAIKRINAICHLGLPLPKERISFKRERRLRAIIEQMAQEEADRKQSEAEYDRILTAWIVNDRIIRAAAPKTPEDEIYGRYAEALKWQPYLEYLLDYGW